MLRRRSGMGMLALGLAVAMTGALAGIRAATLYGCGGTPIVVCSRTAYLAKFVGGNVVNPGTGNPATVPIGLVPFVSWNQAVGANGFICAQPTSAVIRLDITCTPVGGGAAVAVPTITIPMMAPGAPGIQSSPGGGAGPTLVTIPGGLLTTGVQYQCTVVGVYEVDFGGGPRGAGTIRGLGDTTLCIVDPAATDSSQPRLDVRYIDIGDGGYSTALRGDQVIHHYLVANNDLNEAVVLRGAADSNQIARLPFVVNGSTDTHAISLPTPNTDHFPNTFSGGVDPGQLIPLPDPTKAGSQRVDGSMFLAPGQIEIVSIVNRSHGMCADGSCSDAVFSVNGNWVDSGDTAIGCAGTTTIVDSNAPLRSPLCEIEDSMSVSSALRVINSPAVFDRNEMYSTHHAGNVPPGTIELAGAGGGTQLVGNSFASLNSLEGFPSFSNDTLRLHHVPNSIWYESHLFTDLGDTPRHSVDVTIKNFNGQSSSLPFYRSEKGNSSFKVFHDRNRATLRITEGKRVRYNGDFFNFFENTPNGLVADSATSRSFNKFGLPFGAFPGVFPPAGTVNDGMTFPSLVTVDANASAGIGIGSATASVISGNNLSISSTAQYGALLGGTVVPNGIPIAPQPPNLHLVRVFDSGSSRGPVVPIAVRSAMSMPVAGLPFDVDAVTIKVDFAKPEASRDSVQLKFRFPIANASKSFEGEGFTVEFGGFSETFTLDKKGKAKVQKLKDGKKDQKGSISVKLKNGVGRATFTISKADLAGYLADEGLLNKTVKPAGPGIVKIKFIFCGKTFETFAKLSIKSTEGKKAKGKLDKTL